MKNKLVKRALLFCLTALMVLFAAVALADDPIVCEMEVSQAVLTGEGTVRVNINVINVSDDGDAISVTLYDPAKNVCSSFGSGGTANLAPGSSASYSGSWTVTQEQLNAGKITYIASYKVTDADGNVNAVSRPIAKAITFQQATPKLHVQRTAPTKAVEGQTTAISYLLTNTGTVDITNIQITDEGLPDTEPLTCALLGVGQSVELTNEFVMGASAVTTKPTITYSYLEGSEEKQNKTSGGEKTIEVATVDVLVQLSAKSLIVNKGDKVELDCTITNKGDMEYIKLAVTDATLGSIESGITLGAKKEYSIKKSITVSNSGTYKFTVTALDSSGATVTFTSNELTIQTAEDVKETLGDDAIVPDLEVLVEADREIIYTEPSEIAFLVKVTNFGRLAAENVVISEGSTKVKTIDVIQPNETVTFAKMFTTTMGGQIQFTASMKDSAGEEHKFESNIVKVTYVAPAPTPTPTPVPTPVPTATPEPTETVSVDVSPFVDGQDGGTSTGRVLLYVLAGLLLVILVAVTLLVVADRRKNQPPRGDGPRSGHEVVIDSMERGSRRDYAAAPRRARSRRYAEQPAEEPAYQPDEEEPYRAQIPPEDEYDEPVKPRYAPREEREMRTFDVTGDAPRYDAEPTEAGSSYLHRMRSTRGQYAAEPEENGTPMTDDEAALVSGGETQYRISRATNDVRRSAYDRQPQDPQAFARSQRFARGQQPEEPDEQAIEQDEENPDA